MESLTEHFAVLAAPGVRGLQPYQPGKPLSEVERELGISDAVKLASNENPLGPSPKAVAAAREVIADIHRYPDGNGFSLKRALAQKLGVQDASITLGNGSNDVLEMVARAFLTPQNNVVFSEHAFALYPIVTQAVGATARIAPAIGRDRKNAYGYDLAALASLVDADTRLLFVANPNNPTGTWLASGELREFVASLPEHVLVIVDEAYFEYVSEQDYPDTVPWIREYPNLIVTRTFSKAYGLAGLRVGYGVSCPEVADLLNRVRQPFNLNMVAEVAAVAALDDMEHLQRSVQSNHKGMKQLTQAVTEMGLEYIPSVANFVCVRFGDNAQDVHDALLQAGVVVRPVANYGIPDFLRITIGSSEENNKVIDVLRQIL